MKFLLFLLLKEKKINEKTTNSSSFPFHNSSDNASLSHSCVTKSFMGYKYEGLVLFAKDKDTQFLFPSSRKGKKILLEEFTMQTHPFFLHSPLVPSTR